MASARPCVCTDAHPVLHCTAHRALSSGDHHWGMIGADNLVTARRHGVGSGSIHKRPHTCGQLQQAPAMRSTAVGGSRRLPLTPADRVFMVAGAWSFRRFLVLVRRRKSDRPFGEPRRTMAWMADGNCDTMVASMPFGPTRTSSDPPPSIRAPVMSTTFPTFLA